MAIVLSTPEEIEQSRKMTAVVSEMALTTEPTDDKRRQWYTVVRANDAAGLAIALKALEDRGLVSERHIDASGVKALVISKEGPMDGDLYI